MLHLDASIGRGGRTERTPVLQRRRAARTAGLYRATRNLQHADEEGDCLPPLSFASDARRGVQPPLPHRRGRGLTPLQSLLQGLQRRLQGYTSFRFLAVNLQNYY